MGVQAVRILMYGLAVRIWKHILSPGLILVEDDNSALKAAFIELSVFVGPGVQISENRKNCYISLGLKCDLHLNAFN